jgi:hypothetical protein
MTTEASRDSLSRQLANAQFRSNGTDAPLLPEIVLDQIVHTAGIPQELQAIGRRLVQFYVDCAFEEYKYRLRGTPTPPRSELKRVAQLSKELAETLAALSRGVYALELYFKGDGGAFGSLLKFELTLRTLSDAAVRLMSPSKRTDAHRPRFSVKNPTFHHLVQGLYSAIVKNSQGRFAVRKSSTSGELKGTAPAVLNLLQPYLPDIVPRKLAYSTLRRMLQQAKATALAQQER